MTECFFQGWEKRFCVWLQNHPMSLPSNVKVFLLAFIESLCFLWAVGSRKRLLGNEDNTLLDESYLQGGLTSNESDRACMPTVRRVSQHPTFWLILQDRVPYQRGMERLVVKESQIVKSHPVSFRRIPSWKLKSRCVLGVKFVLKYQFIIPHGWICNFTFLSISASVIVTSILRSFSQKKPASGMVEVPPTARSGPFAIVHLSCKPSPAAKYYWNRLENGLGGRSLQSNAGCKIPLCTTQRWYVNQFACAFCHRQLIRVWCVY